MDPSSDVSAVQALLNFVFSVANVSAALVLIIGLLVGAAIFAFKVTCAEWVKDWAKISWMIVASALCILAVLSVTVGWPQVVDFFTCLHGCR